MGKKLDTRPSGYFDFNNMFYRLTSHTDTDGVYITEVKFNGPATIVFWSDNTKTVSKCSEQDYYNSEMGLLVAILKKFISGDSLNKIINQWIDPTGLTNVMRLSDVRYNLKKEAERSINTQEAVG